SLLRRRVPHTPRFRALALLRRLLLLRVEPVVMQASEKPSHLRHWRPCERYALGRTICELLEPRSVGIVMLERRRAGCSVSWVATALQRRTRRWSPDTLLVQRR